MIGLGGADGPAAAQKLDPDTLSHPLHLTDQNGADLSGSADVGPPARAPVAAVEGADSEGPLSTGRPAELSRRGRLLESHLDRPVLGHDLVGSLFGTGDLLLREGAAIQLQSRALTPKMNPDRLVAGKFGQYRREEVLSGMLLHMVEAAAPVDLTSGTVSREGGS